MNEKILARSRGTISTGLIVVLLIVEGLAVAGFLFSLMGHDDEAWIHILIVLMILPLLWIVWATAYKTKLIVTDKRVYAETVWGIRVDLPLDSITAVGKGLLNRITVTTASGSIRFFFIKNREELYRVLCDLLLQRQEQTTCCDLFNETQSKADELKKYKELLDIGAINEQEYEIKKKQLLEL